MRKTETYRGHRKMVANMFDMDMVRADEIPGLMKPAGQGKLAMFMRRHPKIAPFYTAAVGMLSTGSRAQQPRWRAVKKMMIVLATAPRIKPIGMPMPVPFPLMQYRHQRPSWRSYPRQVLDANLKVADAQ